MIPRLHNSRIIKKRTPLSISKAKKYESLKGLTQEYINATVALAYCTNINECFIKTKKREILDVRQVMQYFGAICKDKTRLSLDEIGRQTGGKHHATVLHSKSVIEKLLSNPGEKKLKQKIESINKRLNVNN